MDFENFTQNPINIQANKLAEFSEEYGDNKNRRRAVSTDLNLESI